MSDLLNQSELKPSVLTIAGSDSGAGAGIQADLKTFAAHGVYGVCAITMVTAQNTQGVTSIEMVPPPVIEQQLDSVFSDFRINAVKTGALGNSETIKLVSSVLAGRQVKNLVVDPVMISKHGHNLVAEDAIPTIREKLLPLALVVTPNIPEAQVLAGLYTISNRDEMVLAARAICESGCEYVVVKGGHFRGDPADLIWDGKRAVWLESTRIDSRHTHGTGCTFSSAIAAGLALGLPVVEAVTVAKDYITGAISNARMVGRGINPVNHIWRSDFDC